VSLNPSSLNKTLQESAARLQSSKQNVEEQLERVKGEKVSLQQEINQQKDENEKLKETLETSKDQHLPTQSRKRKSWNEYLQRHKARKIQALQEKVINLLTDEQFEVGHLEVRNKDSGCSEKFQICSSIANSNQENIPSSSQAVNQVLYTKEKYHGVSDQAYHELSMVSA